MIRIVNKSVHAFAIFITQNGMENGAKWYESWYTGSNLQLTNDHSNRYNGEVAQLVSALDWQLTHPLNFHNFFTTNYTQ